MYFDINRLPAETVFNDNLAITDPEVMRQALNSKAEGQLWALGLSTKLEYNTEFNGIIAPIETYSTTSNEGTSTAGGAAYGTSSWMAIARAELGTKEFSNGSNPRIDEYHDTTNQRNSSDDVSWCSSFVNWVMTKAGYKGTNSAWARNWTTWGTSVAPGTIGSIVVFARGKGGHVGFCVGYVPGKHVVLLGGNQSNAVTITNDRRRILGWRWPTQGDRR